MFQPKRKVTETTAPPLFRLTFYVLFSLLFFLFLVLHLLGSILMLLWALVLLTQSTLTSHDHLQPYFVTYRKSCLLLYKTDTFILCWYDPTLARELHVPRDESDVSTVWHSLVYFYIWRGLVNASIALLPAALWTIAGVFFVHFFNYAPIMDDPFVHYFYDSRWFLLLNGGAYVSFGVVVGNALIRWCLDWSTFANSLLFPIIDYNIARNRYESVALLSMSRQSIVLLDDYKLMAVVVGSQSMIAKTMPFDQTVDTQITSPVVATVLKLAHRNDMAKAQASLTLSLAGQMFSLAAASPSIDPAILQWLNETINPLLVVEWDADDFQRELHRLHRDVDRLLQRQPPSLPHTGSGTSLIDSGFGSTGRSGRLGISSTGPAVVIDHGDDDESTAVSQSESRHKLQFSHQTNTDARGWGPLSHQGNDPLRHYHTFSPRASERTYGVLSPRVDTQTNTIFRSIEDKMDGTHVDPVDPVFFTAYAPPTISIGTAFYYDIWAFLAHQRDDVHDAAKSANAFARKLSRDVLMPIRRGAVAHLQLYLPPGFLVLDDPVKTLEWTGNELKSVQFHIECTPDAPAGGQSMVQVKIVVGAKVMVLSSYLFISPRNHQPQDNDVEMVPLTCELERLEETYHEIPYHELELQDAVGRGHFGEAFRANYRGRQVVVKTLRPDTFGESTDQIVQEFRHEAAVLNMFGHHPNIVPFVGASTDPSSMLTLVTEYLPHGSLRDAFPSKLSLTEKEVILYDAAAGLVNIHEGGFIHRDIAARNVLVDDELRGKICDFGLCRRVNASVGGGHFQEGQFPLKYMAPESLQPPYAFSYRSDAYMFGVLMWETFSEASPFASMSAPEAAALVLEGHRLDHTSVPDKYQDLLAACFEQDPMKRPALVSIMRAFEPIDVV
ncbi:unnamed protein product [Aphanomyces euteiches]